MQKVSTKGKPRKLKNWVKIPNSRIREATERENRENERKKFIGQQQKGK